jgi:hypothetical protein
MLQILDSILLTSRLHLRVVSAHDDGKSKPANHIRFASRYWSSAYAPVLFSPRLSSLLNFFFQLTIATANKVNFLLPNVITQRSPERNETSNLPVYVKHGFPEVFKNKADHYDYLPKLSRSPSKEAEENYGLMYHKPETDAEIKMHDLWVARRRQEVR